MWGNNVSPGFFGVVARGTVTGSFVLPVLADEAVISRILYSCGV